MAAQRNRAGSHVPRFGNWDANDHAPFTKVFDTARAERGGKLINPNDPSENPEAFVPVNRPPTENPPKGHLQEHDNLGDPARRGRPDQHRPRHGSREDGEFKRYMESPARYRQSPGVGRTTSASESHRRYNAVEGHRSPLHPQAKIPEKAVPTLPKFGDWDAKDPSSGEGFTVIFNNARTEKQTGAGLPPQVNSGASDYQQHPGYGRGNGHHSRKQQSNWFCCFS